MYHLARQCAVALLIAHALPVSADVYRRIDDNGNVTITNIPPRNTAPASGPLSNGSGRPAIAATLAETPTAVARVNPDHQRKRDDDRVRILERELQSEVEALSSATMKKDAAEATRRQANIDALKRELARTQ